MSFAGVTADCVEAAIAIEGMEITLKASRGEDNLKAGGREFSEDGIKRCKGEDVAWPASGHIEADLRAKD